MYTTININPERNAIFTGRNGTFNMAGLQIWKSHDTVCLNPVTRRGLAANCILIIPDENIPELIQELQKLIKRKRKGG